MRYLAFTAFGLIASANFAAALDQTPPIGPQGSVAEKYQLDYVTGVLKRYGLFDSICLGVWPNPDRRFTRYEVVIGAHVGLQNLKAFNPLLEKALSEKDEKAMWDLVLREHEVGDAVELALELLDTEFRAFGLKPDDLKEQLLKSRNGYAHDLRRVVSSSATDEIRAIAASGLLLQQGFAPSHFPSPWGSPEPEPYGMVVCAHAGSSYLQSVAEHLEQSLAEGEFGPEEAAGLRELVRLHRELGPSIDVLLNRFERELSAAGSDPEVEQQRFAGLTSRIDSLLISPFVPFLDVPSNHWAAPAVNELKAAGLLKGYPGVKFSK